MNDVLHQKWQFECNYRQIRNFSRSWKHINSYVLWHPVLGSERGQKSGRSIPWRSSTPEKKSSWDSIDLDIRLGCGWQWPKTLDLCTMYVNRIHEKFMYTSLYVIMYIYIYYVFQVQKHSFRKLVGFVHKLFDGTFRISTWNSGRWPWVHRLS